MTNSSSDSRDRAALLEFIRIYGIPALIDATTQDTFEPGVHIDVYVAAEIARLTKEDQVRFPEAFARVYARNKARRQDQNMRRKWRRFEKVLLPVLEQLMRKLFDRITEWLRKRRR